MVGLATRSFRARRTAFRVDSTGVEGKWGIDPASVTTSTGITAGANAIILAIASTAGAIVVNRTAVATDPIGEGTLIACWRNRTSALCLRTISPLTTPNP